MADSALPPMREHLTLSERLERLSLLFGGVIAALFTHSACNLLFGCGCTFPLLGAGGGGTAHCNIHTPGVPHCPWCTMGDAGFAAVAAFLVLGELAALVLARRRFGRRLGTSLAAVVVGFAAAALLAGFVVGRLHGYPYFLGLRL